MEPVTLQFIAEASKGTFHPHEVGCVSVSGVCTDSRRLQAGNLFLALCGERFDGHDFLKDSGLKKASAVVVSQNRLTDVPPGIPAVSVRNTREALGHIAAAYRNRFSLPVFCVAGSNGKTTTKELLAALLETQFPTLRSQASFNNDIGVPLSLLELDGSHRAAVLEAGTNHPGELAPLVRLIVPRYGVVPQIGREHLEHFGDIDGVIAEESALGEGLPADGVLFLNGDCDAARPLASRTSARVVRTGFDAGNDWQARILENGWTSTRFEVTAPKPEWCGVFEIAVPGRHMVSNAILALAAAAELRVQPEAARKALSQFSGAKQRLQWSEQRGIRWLDDTYNANADSTLAALQTLSELPCTGRRVAVLGDMAELGEHTTEAHREVGAAAHRLGIDLLVCIGNSAGHTAYGASGLRQVLAFSDVEQAVLALRPLIQPGDCVLAKASRSSRLERLFEALKGESIENH
ncbi:MAG: UDP-N-acetylmuramoyl-tripeptide--D-alanyl-D-alanine ligase [Verrucomicrobia bacterium]|nr:UDP-N-acetylmuramoyl-tripeptide--D-alanyl-D-alanine ligase [Verrucomicrobiota bacterium]